MSSQWFIKGKSKNLGPYSSAQISQLISLKKLNQQHQVSTDQQQWVRLIDSPFKTAFPSPSEPKNHSPHQGTKVQPALGTSHTPPPIAEQPHESSDASAQLQSSQTVYSDILMIIMVILPIFAAVALFFGIPKSLALGITGVVATALAFVDRQALEKLGLTPPHWFWVLIPLPWYLKKREHVYNNPYFFTLSSISAGIFAATLYFGGSNENHDSYVDDTIDWIQRDQIKQGVFDEQKGHFTLVVGTEEDYQGNWVPYLEIKNQSEDEKANRYCQINTLDYQQRGVVTFDAVQYSFDDDISTRPKRCLSGKITYTLDKTTGKVSYTFDVNSAYEGYIYVVESTDSNGRMWEYLKIGHNYTLIDTTVNPTTVQTY